MVRRKAVTKTVLGISRVLRDQKNGVANCNTSRWHTVSAASIGASHGYGIAGSEGDIPQTGGHAAQVQSGACNPDREVAEY